LEIQMTVDLAGDIAIVTGGAGAGCGAAISEALARAGATVLIFDKDESRVFKIADEIKNATGRDVRGFCINITDEAALETLMPQIATEFGTVTMLVNNAAINKPMGFTDYSVSLFKKILDTDFTAAWNLTRLTYPAMVAARRGSIINISSVAPYTAGGVQELPYSAAKAALHELTRTIAVEGGPHGVRANALLLCVVRTPFVERYWDQLNLSEVVAATPTRQLISVSEVTDTILFLLSPSAVSITGEMLNLSGGHMLTL
jgi:NAD(P)-dependent dehydrogenase (short-subunit alcohol dehydrogenase family)